jgi:glycosyltransferase involved in cell wall biosynthesis
MDRQPLVSIVLPAFNAERTLGDALASVLLQTYQNWELLLIDDGSRDQTAAIARKFGDPRIRIFSDGTNKGLPARLNEAIDRSSGKYFARMDQDDVCFPERLSRQVAFLEAHPEVDLVGVRAVTFVTPGELTGFFPFCETHEEICRRPWNGFYLPHPTWMGRLDWFKKHRYRSPEVRRAEDQELLLRTYPTSRFACLPEVLFAYRLRSAVSLKINMTARKSLLQTQLRIFTARRQWGYAVLALLAFAAKVVSDLRAWLTGRRMNRLNPELAGQLPKWEELKLKLAQVQQ